MQKDLKGIKGNSLENAIVLESANIFAGVSEEHAYLDKVYSTLIGIRSVEQNLIIEGQKQYDKFVILLEDGDKRILYFDISSFFGKISVGGRR